MIIKMIKPQLENKDNKTLENIDMLEMIGKGKDCVEKDDLNEIIEWVKENK